MSSETLRPLHAAFDAHRSASATASKSGASAIGRVDVSIKQGWIFKPFHSLYARLLRDSVPASSHSLSALLTGSTHTLEMEIGMDDAAAGFGYLIDQSCRVRWSQRLMPKHYRRTKTEKALDADVADAAGVARLEHAAEEMLAVIRAVEKEEEEEEEVVVVAVGDEAKTAGAQAAGRKKSRE